MQPSQQVNWILVECSDANQVATATYDVTLSDCRSFLTSYKIRYNEFHGTLILFQKSRSNQVVRRRISCLYPLEQTQAVWQYWRSNCEKQVIHFEYEIGKEAMQFELCANEPQGKMNRSYWLQCVFRLN
jgi:hypothetical protein